MYEGQKKIAFFIPSLEVGGAEKVFLNVGNEMVRRGLAVDFVLVRKRGEYIEELDHKISVISAKRPSFPGTFFCLLKYIKKEKPDVVISSIWYCNFINILITRMTGSHNSCLIRETSHPLRFYESLSVWIRWVYKIYWFSYKWADFIICPSRKIAEFFYESYLITDKNIKIINNPADIKMIHKLARKTPEHPWIKSNQYNTVISVGRLNNAKAFDDLIRACKLLGTDNWRLIILGEGEERSALERLISELKIDGQVDLYGFESNPYSYMKHADVFVLSSRFEGMPNTLIEALICGATIVATNCDSGPSEILEDGRNGQLVEVGNIEALSNAIRDRIEKEDVASTPDISKYDINHVTEQYLELL